MVLNLVKNGIFPIVFDKNNNLIDSKSPYTIPGTLQGEGLFTGTPSLFLRLSGCNLRCMWESNEGVVNLCDTYYSSFKPEINKIEIEEIAQVISNNLFNVKHLVISGGEPFLQSEVLSALLRILKPLDLTITIETNGTVFNQMLATYVDLFSISPKLSSSNPTEDKIKKTKFGISKSLIKQHNDKRINIDVLQQFVNYSNLDKKWFQLKFVVSKSEDLKEINENILNKLTGWKQDNVYLMPEGITPEELIEKSHWLAGECVKYGFNFSQRLHVNLWGHNRQM